MAHAQIIVRVGPTTFQGDVTRMQAEEMVTFIRLNSRQLHVGRGSHLQ